MNCAVNEKTSKMMSPWKVHLYLYSAACHSCLFFFFIIPSRCLYHKQLSANDVCQYHHILPLID